MELKDFLKVVGDQGKVVIVGDDGNVRGVFLSFEEYQKMDHVVAGIANKNEEKSKVDVTEKVNREILNAQLEEVVATADGGSGGVAIGDAPEKDFGTSELDLDPKYAPESIESLIERRSQELFKSVPLDSPLPHPHEHFRTPNVATNSDEELSPNFENI